MLNMQPMKIFSKVKGNSEFPEDSPFSGDVLSHLGLLILLRIGISSNLSYGFESEVNVSVLENPSHLEVRVLFLS